jgi:hypothetical protein
MIQHPYPVGTLCLVVSVKYAHDLLGRECVTTSEMYIQEGVEQEPTSSFTGYKCTTPDGFEFFAEKISLIAIQPDGDIKEEQKDKERPKEPELVD